jgi:cobyrinic acid a,c-diamide synthase
MRLSTPRLVLAGLAGDSGKTLVSLGLARALRDRGLRVAPFKKGPDYIDAGWLGVAAGRPGRNLDTFLLPREGIGEALARGGAADIALVEGNRGLYDGLDAAGTHSTAELAKLLAAPVVLVVDVTKSTRTVAAVVLGCRALDRQVNLAGVVLNRVGTARQERVIRDAISDSGGPPVLGAIPRIAGGPLPGRHLGLVPVAEHPDAELAVRRAAELVAEHTDLDALVTLAGTAPAVELPRCPQAVPGPPATVAVCRDEAFSFYYPENLEALEEAGAELRFVSPLAQDDVQDADALYVGGGFPEVHAERLAQGRPALRSLREAVSAGLPVYAECGGLMFLARELVVQGTSYPMAGVLEITVEQTAKPRGHGYVIGEVDGNNPYFPPGTRLRGHEFHYSRVVGGKDRSNTVLRLSRGVGLGEGRDGISLGRVWASYVHLHALGSPAWASSFVTLARTYQQERRDGDDR